MPYHRADQLNFVFEPMIRTRASSICAVRLQEDDFPLFSDFAQPRYRALVNFIYFCPITPDACQDVHENKRNASIAGNIARCTR